MVTETKKRKSRGSRRRFIGKPTGLIQERVQAVGPEHFGIVAVDCAKRRSKWMLCNFYGKVLVEPTTVEHTSGGLRTMTQRVAEVCRAEGLTDTIVAVEMTGIYHKPVFRAFRKAGFDTRVVHPFASNHYRRPLHPAEKTDDCDLEAIFHAAVKGYGLAAFPVGEDYQSLQAISRHRHNLVKQRSRLMVQIRRLLHQTMPGFADLFEDNKLFHKSIALPIAQQFSSAAAIRLAGVAGIASYLTKTKVRFQTRTIERIVAWAGTAADSSELAEMHTRQWQQLNEAGLYPSRYQSDEVDHPDGSLVRQCNRQLRGAAMLVAENLIKCHPYYRGLSELWKQQKVDPLDRRCRIANRAMRMVYQLVAGRQVWRSRGVDREYLLAKLQEFHRVHHTPIAEAIRELNEALTYRRLDDPPADSIGAHPRRAWSAWRRNGTIEGVRSSEF